MVLLAIDASGSLGQVGQFGFGALLDCKTANIKIGTVCSGL